MHTRGGLHALIEVEVEGEGRGALATCGSVALSETVDKCRTLQS